MIKEKTGRSSLNHISVKSSKTTRNRNDTVMEILIAKRDPRDLSELIKFDQNKMGII